MMLTDFDPSNKKHVAWLRELIRAPVKDKIDVLNKNPMKAKVPPFEVIQIVFGLSMMYTKAVFDKTAVFLDD